MKRTILHNAAIVTSDREGRGSVVICGEKIEAVLWQDENGNIDLSGFGDAEIQDLEGLCLMAGGIDAHVHFRDPGLTHKGDFRSESTAALLGGVTSVIDMPNTVPATTSWEALQEKRAAVAGKSIVNYGFHIGATNSNFEELQKAIDEHRSEIAGIKVFMGSSTGNMLVDSDSALQKIFQLPDIPVFVHCEDESTIRANLEAAKARYGDNIPFAEHPSIRSRHACIVATARALEMAMKYGTRLHICHISTREEADMVKTAKMQGAKVTAETSVNYLWFCDEDYERLGSKIKCNPAIKSPEDREALIQALRDGVIDTIGSDHAPHLISEKTGNYLSAPSGIPSIQHSLPVLLTLSEKENIPLQRISSAFSGNPAQILGLRDRGAIEAGRRADIVVIDKDMKLTVKAEDLAYKCGWSPYEGQALTGRVMQVYLGGKKIVDGGHLAKAEPSGEELKFGI